MILHCVVVQFVFNLSPPSFLGSFSFATKDELLRTKHLNQAQKVESGLKKSIWSHRVLHEYGRCWRDVVVVLTA